MVILKDCGATRRYNFNVGMCVVLVDNIRLKKLQTRVTKYFYSCHDEELPFSLQFWVKIRRVI